MSQVEPSKTRGVSHDLITLFTRPHVWPKSLATIYGANGDPSGFSKDFVTFCKTNGFANAEFLKNGRNGFGGFANGRIPSSRNPVILVHGNGADATFMAPVIEELLRRGYGPQDIFAVSYASGNPLASAVEAHSPKYARDIRAFFDAVTKYRNGMPPVIVAHSKGVTDSLLALNGVSIDSEGVVDHFAKKLSARTFIGISGATQGLSSCRFAPYLPVANRYNGLHPTGKLVEILPTLGKPATAVYSMVARDDELTGTELRTTRIPFQDGQIILPKGGHLGPIVEPGALVDLITRRSTLVQKDAFESIRDGALWQSPLLPQGLSDTVLTASGQFAYAALHLTGPLFDGGRAIDQAAAGLKTLVDAAFTAVGSLPPVRIAAAAADALLPAKEEAAT